jgi:hypothetical protein
VEDSSVSGTSQDDDDEDILITSGGQAVGKHDSQGSDEPVEIYIKKSNISLSYGFCSHFHSILLTNIKNWQKKIHFCIKVNQTIIFRKSKMHFDARNIFFLGIS